LSLPFFWYQRRLGLQLETSGHPRDVRWHCPRIAAVTALLGLSAGERWVRQVIELIEHKVDKFTVLASESFIGDILIPSVKLTKKHECKNKPLIWRAALDWSSVCTGGPIAGPRQMESSKGNLYTSPPVTPLPCTFRVLEDVTEWGGAKLAKMKHVVLLIWHAL
jgi:hypothetical protein